MYIQCISLTGGQVDPICDRKFVCQRKKEIIASSRFLNQSCNLVFISDWTIKSNCWLVHQTQKTLCRDIFWNRITVTCTRPVMLFAAFVATARRLFSHIDLSSACRTWLMRLNISSVVWESCIAIARIWPFSILDPRKRGRCASK